MNSEEKLILVDEKDSEIGWGYKLQVHREGLLHRAFSIFIFDSQGRLLLQRRATGKYHCGGLWTNTCCGHPRVGESLAVAAHRRLWEEVGMRAELSVFSQCIYKVDVGPTMTEFEFDHLFIGIHDNSDFNVNPVEVAAWRWVNGTELLRILVESPSHFTPWFHVIVEQQFDKIAAMFDQIVGSPLITGIERTHE
jgi:isopentenyl-diphosphate Delta-isomerase